MEYHAFGIVSYVAPLYWLPMELIVLSTSREGRHAKYHYMIAGVQGEGRTDLIPRIETDISARRLYAESRRRSSEDAVDPRAQGSDAIFNCLLDIF